ncbi:sigma-70 family RNA polymerase sigma factor [Bacillus cytotoxicus]|uniref:sigma-70 family RNA polymerase sigma factor n=1 Tax=Bacillus cytotoxicus TaxID=580165 RepID=UPI001AEE5BBC|nr:sigma-70 family RNA polymerase sigma factor [Bacillus cytotoxicus]MDH2890655.1 sigma-70 family RNA polymerase sigma factor [Bacillus cytotoxicus]QTR75028.1 sigma-70 family RNA polymerase sigma factor [Bacillus cytotoxicus]
MTELIDVKALSDEEFIQKYEKFVFHFIHKKYGHRLQAIKDDTGLEFEDLVQCGMIALIKAREQFKPEMGFKFLTFAVPKIIGEIGNEIWKTQKLKIERTVYYAKGKILKNKLSEESVDHISETLDIDPKLVEAAQDYQPGTFSIDKVFYPDDNGEGEKITLEKQLEDESVDVESTVENKVILHSFFDTLQHSELVVWDMHSKGTRQENIGKRIGKSQVQVSRILGRINKRATAFGQKQGIAK